CARTWGMWGYFNSW
nr:immunoglobulin heavy chain junction region [Macaca mulatta]MOX15596.1 immunoglobulin heavy chain junction region [Macaca mulatta]MOX16352.1 immunoglobulin heavy chain junction region [Macaca mulatta]